MRQKAGHSMMRCAPSTHAPEGPPTRAEPMNRHEVRQRRPPHPRKPRDRTSRPESQASERHRSRSACSGRQRHPPCRSSDGQKPADRTMDATDTKARESRSRGCYQAALYNTIKPHSSLSHRPPAPQTSLQERPHLNRRASLSRWSKISVRSAVHVLKNGL